MSFVILATFMIPFHAISTPLFGVLKTLPLNDLSVRVNDEQLSAAVVDGWLHIERDWKPDDEVALDLPLEPRFTRADPCVDADRGLVAMERGRPATRRPRGRPAQRARGGRARRRARGSDDPAASGHLPQAQPRLVVAVRGHLVHTGILDGQHDADGGAL